MKAAIIVGFCALTSYGRAPTPAAVDGTVPLTCSDIDRQHCSTRYDDCLRNAGSGPGEAAVRAECNRVYTDCLRANGC